MKKFILTAMLVLPLTSWQVYKGGVLTVFSGDNDKTSIVYQGKPDGYHGEATQPAQGKWTASYLPTWGPESTTPSN